MSAAEIVTGDSVPVRKELRERNGGYTAADMTAEERAELRLWLARNRETLIAEVAGRV